jgi:excisionase family DNA binding protein
MEPITLTIDDTRKCMGLGKTKVFELIAEKKLETVKVGRRTLVKTASIKRFIASLSEAA